MKLHELRSPEGARTRRKRVGRGTGSGHGKTSGRGQKGQNARGQGFRLGFEGGQMPLAQRLPKLGGFHNPFQKRYAVVNLSKLSRFADGDEITPERLYAEGLADDGAAVKILGAGKLRLKLNVQAHAVSESARRAIEARGGSVTLLEPVREEPAAAEETAGPAATAAAELEAAATEATPATEAAAPEDAAAEADAAGEEEEAGDAGADSEDSPAPEG